MFQTQFEQSNISIKTKPAQKQSISLNFLSLLSVGQIRIKERMLFRRDPQLVVERLMQNPEQNFLEKQNFFFFSAQTSRNHPSS
jgi:hypothetical protein